MELSRGPRATAGAGDGFDWNNAAEQSIAGILGLVPDVGSILGALVYIFWPSDKTDIWSEIEAQVEQLIQQKLTQLVKDQVAAVLQGLNNNLRDYLVALKDGSGDPSYISEKWTVVNADFLQQLPTFQLDGYQTLLLPLFAQFANMHLSLLRDGVVGGNKWGWTQDILKQTRVDLTSATTAYFHYAQMTYSTGYNSVVSSTPADNHACQPFRSVNAYVRQMTLTVLDFMNMWQYLDVTKYPNGVTVLNTREIYSDPYGTCDESGNIVLPTPPTQPISEITVWGGDRITAVQLSYSPGGGPGGVTTTPRMGYPTGGSNTPPRGGVFQVANNNPIYAITGGGPDEYTIQWMTFGLCDGGHEGPFGGDAVFEWPVFECTIPNEILSSIHINGARSGWSSADCVVFGFKFQESRTFNSQLRRLLYEAVPFVPASLESNNVTDINARDTYWNDLRRR
jgi:delta endotoxin, N-terminal domain